MTQTLDKDLRNALERTVKAARSVAEAAANAVVNQLGVGADKPDTFLSDTDKALRNRLRRHGQQLGDARDSKSSNPTYGKQELRHLVQEVAYQHWHRMLFARFLAENNLLMYDGVAVTIEECEELAADTDTRPVATSGWELAGKLAARMLPQVFKPNSPVFALAFAPEHQRELERLLAALAPEVFRASDSLGWVYQFWQAQRKDEVNASEVKIGADELPAVTQLFTEPYMVDFLLHNSLGAWWATRHPGKTCPVPLTYLRTLEDGTPAAGPFEGWPDTLADFKLLDPCCGSGHFLVAAFLLLVPMRMAAEGLTAMDAVDYVLQDNLHGLELDARCVEIAVFALALTAWRFPDENGDALGVRADMPAPHVACCGLKLTASADDWVALIPDALSNRELVAQDLRGLHADFAQSPLLGSLVSPSRSLKNDLATSNFAALSELLERALQFEAPTTTAGAGSEQEEDARYLALTARGLMDAARLLEARYHLVITNVPYLARGKQNDTLKNYCATHYPEAKNDLANVFLERCLELSRPQGQGVVQIVMPQNWLFLTSYKKQRESLLKRVQWNLLARLGEGGFDSPQAAGAFIILLTQTHASAPADFVLHGVDASVPKAAQEKAVLLREGEVLAVSQKGQLGNPDARVAFEALQSSESLNVYARIYQGIGTSDAPRFIQRFWEGESLVGGWVHYQMAPENDLGISGLHSRLFWCDGGGPLVEVCQKDAQFRGKSGWNRRGVCLGVTRGVKRGEYFGNHFDCTFGALVALDEDNLPAIYAYAVSDEFIPNVRRVDQALSITETSFGKVPFDLAHWQQVAAERYPDGLPQPYSDDPTQWLFHGHPLPATDPLQVAVARLVGYRWPAELQTPPAAELDAKSASSPYAASASSYQIDNNQPTETAPHSTAMELSSAAHAWIARCAPLAAHTDDDGIVCLPSVNNEPAAHERLLKLLIAAWDTVEPGSWKNATLDRLLADADCAGRGLEVWLREKFFEQHAKRFHHRPFIWHVWDGLRDGFAALVNYHLLDAKKLERLTHTYLGDWIIRQKRDIEAGVDGAQEKLAAAEVLKKRLELILEGEAPYDIFVRWKPIEEQPIGWNPDLNDGVRLNIRPFLSVPDVGKRGAGVLRFKPNIKWDKDRGTDVLSAPWYELGLEYGGKVGDRINDHHLTLEEKRAAREKAK